MLKANIQVNICETLVQAILSICRDHFFPREIFPTLFPKLKDFPLKIGFKTVFYDDGRLCALNFHYLSIRMQLIFGVI